MPVTERGTAEGLTFPSPPDGDSNQQPALRHAGVVPAHSFRQVSACVAVTPPMPWQRNLNLCGSPRSSSESRRPLDDISVCFRPGQQVGLSHWALPTSGARGRVRVRVGPGLSPSSSRSPGPALQLGPQGACGRHFLLKVVAHPSE